MKKTDNTEMGTLERLARDNPEIADKWLEVTKLRLEVAELGLEQTKLLATIKDIGRRQRELSIKEGFIIELE